MPATGYISWCWPTKTIWSDHIAIRRPLPRFGGRWWAQDKDSGRWMLVCDRWHTGFLDAVGNGGMLAQVEGAPLFVHQQPA